MRRSPEGVPLTKSHPSSSADYARAPASSDVLRKNPFGDYVDAIDGRREFDTAPVPAAARPTPAPAANLPLGSPRDLSLGAPLVSAPPSNGQDTK